MKVLILLAPLIFWISCQECEKGEVLTLSKLVKMKCKKGVWKPQEKRAGPGAPPCVDNPVLVENGSCLDNAKKGHCNQFTVKGQEMDRDCPGTCESCDECRCMDSVQWHSYCGYWSQYCNDTGVLGTWMSTNCRKTCKKCRCKCCSYQGKQHKLGARILLPNVCGALVCEESLQAQPSPLISGAVQHAVSHPEELTLNFKNMLPGRECCLLPGAGRSENSSMVASGGMVQEGWRGSLSRQEGQITITCSHGSLYIPLTDDLCIQTQTTTKTPTTTTTTVALTWKKVYSHDVDGGLFANLDEAKKKNIDDESASLFSVLYNLESMRNDDGVFHFKLCYPELSEEFPCNEWIQSSNPVTESNVTGYSGVKLTYPKNGIRGPFQGLGLSPPSFVNNLIDDAPSHGKWWSSIGTIKAIGSGIIPGPYGQTVKKNELYVAN